ncbi:uncharacterized protein [Elaeis guineensis]|uniref:tRNA-uridine aminocarboxypropyltransferase n=1 Tax=Elaeis guineensis var. tenera TaxID=51953 RepID=A0A6I9RPG4_ELAGV|nr:uncharacterized protein LOC105051459 [Elaeis guineensis]
MPAGFPTGTSFSVIRRSLFSFLYPLFIQRSNLSQDLTLTPEMGSQGPSKRPFCQNCSKPARLCLCSRLQIPHLDNSIAVTILQHSLEKNHPLNSTRIAKLGLKNLAVIAVTDVNFQAQFLIRPLEFNRDFMSSLVDGNCQGKPDSGESSNSLATQIASNDDSGQGVPQKDDLGQGVLDCCTKCECDNHYNFFQPKKPRNPSEKLITQYFLSSQATNASVMETDIKDDAAQVSGLQTDKQIVLSSISGSEEDAQTEPFQSESVDFDSMRECQKVMEDCVTTIKDKCRVTYFNSFLTITIERSAKPNINWVLETPIGRAAISNGFMVSKLQRKQLKGSEEFQDFMEFDIVIPPGSALLYPSEKSISLEAVDFEVKHLLVLDGTWSKAKRIYHENPWLKFLPHLKLESGKESLYSEVRHQPKAWCLSTIESIVCALKTLGDDKDGLDNLLDVFMSMIADQRHCKEEKFRAMSLS